MKKQKVDGHVQRMHQHVGDTHTFHATPLDGENTLSPFRWNCRSILFLLKRRKTMLVR
jgi:hypothetical protein